MGSAGLAIASLPSGLLAFAVPYALGCGVISALGFYHITQPTAMRAAGDQRDRAVVRLTILDAPPTPAARHRATARRATRSLPPGARPCFAAGSPPR